MPGTVLFDDRSARLARTTGWERVTRELCSRLVASPLVTLAGAPVRSSPLRVLSDVAVVPFRARRHRVVHFPSYPPAHVLPSKDVIFTLNDLTWWEHPETASVLGRLLYRRWAERAIPRTHLVVPTRAMAQRIAARFDVPLDRIEVIPWGRTRLPAAEPFRAERPYVLFVGSREPRKNLERLVEAHRRSGVSGSVDLLLVGREAWGPTIGGVKTVTGASDEELSAFYRGAAAVVIPSLHEGFGLPILEALEVGVAVACSDLDVFREVAGEHALYFDPYDVDSIAAAIDAAVGSTPDGDARARHAATFDWDRVAEAYLSLYERLLA